MHVLAVSAQFLSTKRLSLTIVELFVAGDLDLIQKKKSSDVDRLKDPSDVWVFDQITLALILKTKKTR